ncbi:hypothetical protein CKAH01_18584 [Colletotrichum kahawae]|uniref:Uncharacterized protein n=1 Tax=Colletotrichum kahawae TaxID=34407 RepID=A0AAD9Y6I1_COLKA|nr:hypothetical protein CKAH01_18584 [Colletotrichum kahawae]
MHCSYYCSSGRRCKLFPRGEVYSECTCLGKSYDVIVDAVYAYKFLAPIVDRLLDEATCLEDAEVAEEECYDPLCMDNS